MSYHYAQYRDAHTVFRQSLSLLAFIIKTFRINDEELLRIHFPIMAFALIDVVDGRKMKVLEAPTSQLEALHVAAILLREIPVEFFENDGEAPTTIPTDVSNMQLAEAFYGAESLKQVDFSHMSYLKHPTFHTKGLSSILRVVAEIASQPPSGKRSDMLDASLDVLETFLQSIRPVRGQVFLDWEPDIWAVPVLECLPGLAIDVR